MEPSLYVSLSGQIALQRRLDTIANNVANSSTPGFRAENVTFKSELSRQGVAYANEGDATFARQPGPLVETGNPLDVAIQGDAFLAIATPAGTVFTRDGRMRIAASGELETLNGHAVLDAAGAPLRINPSLGEIAINHDGTISQNGNQIGSLGLFRIPADARIARGTGGGLIADRPGEAVTNFRETGLKQGYIESAGVNPVLEMTRLIAVSRAFEALSSAIDQSDRKLSEAIRALGDGQR